MVPSEITPLNNADWKPQARLDKLQQQHPNVSLPVLVIMALLDIMKDSKASSTFEFLEHAKAATTAFKQLPEKKASMIAGADLFLHPLKTHSEHIRDVEDWKKSIFALFEKRLAEYAKFRERAADKGLQFIKDDAVILVHSYSRAVMMLLQKARQANKRFKVFVTETRPTTSGAVVELRAANIPAELILDAAVGSIIDRVDMVIVGAEGVVQNGGVINQIGTYQIAVVAKAANKPFYAVTEQYKFVRLFPLNQEDLPIASPPYFASSEDRNTIVAKNPQIDYTPPRYISLLFTNIGVLTPSAVSEELVKFYMS
ncbi:S-methyl-5-thioribose-1-phosphate isomerase [Spizellomyces sp. 'palustris']|nr:S-methyl-5-thioribose-1-phosphate isomerase [Spizellomyces sp. 'palustris']